MGRKPTEDGFKTTMHLRVSQRLLDDVDYIRRHSDPIPTVSDVMRDSVHEIANRLRTKQEAREKRRKARQAA